MFNAHLVATVPFPLLARVEFTVQECSNSQEMSAYYEHDENDGPINRSHSIRSSINNSLATLRAMDMYRDTNSGQVCIIQPTHNLAVQ